MPQDNITARIARTIYGLIVPQQILWAQVEGRMSVVHVLAAITAHKIQSESSGLNLPKTSVLDRWNSCKRICF